MTKTVDLLPKQVIKVTKQKRYKYLPTVNTCTLFSSISSGFHLLAHKFEKDIKIRNNNKSKLIDKNVILEAVLGVRHIQAVMLFLCLVLAYGMRVNMSLAIVAMTDSDNEHVGISETLLWFKNKKGFYSWFI